MARAASGMSRNVVSAVAVVGLTSTAMRAALGTRSWRRPSRLAITSWGKKLMAKRLGLLHALVPKAARIAVLVNPTTATAETTLRDIPEAARAIGLPIQVLNASTIREIEAAFAALVRDR